MDTDLLDKEILELTIKLNKSLIELQEEGNGFLDKSKIDKVFSTNKLLQEKLNLKNITQ